jgi:hypothetical protein
MLNLKNRLCQLFSTKPSVENNFDLDNIPPCPVCASTDVAIFIYGKPPLRKVILEGLESGKIISGGCMIRRTAPKWHCYNCNKDFGRLR